MFYYLFFFSLYEKTKQICEEWEAIGYPDIDVRYTALVKLTNTICEQCQHYARRTNKKLTENRYFTDLARTRSFNVSRKLCTLVNDIEFVKRHVLSSLPTLLNFSDVIDKMIDHYETDNFKQLRTTLERLIATAEQEMTDVIKLILDHVAEFIRLSLKSKIKNYYIEERRGRPNVKSLFQLFFFSFFYIHYSSAFSKLIVISTKKFFKICTKVSILFNILVLLVPYVLKPFNVWTNYYL